MNCRVGSRSERYELGQDMRDELGQELRDMSWIKT